jgi:DNA-binding MarR family transcriptional regulator
MRAADLHRLARVLRETALVATANPGEGQAPAGLIAIVEDIARHEATSVGEIARRTGLAQSLVSTTVASLREAGALTTERDPRDARRQLISIEASMQKSFRSRGARPVSGALREMFPEAPKQDLRRAEELLDELAALLM